MSAIEWTDAVWNPVTGCTKVSAGCKNCYAERFANRGLGSFTEYTDHAKGAVTVTKRAFTDVRCHQERLPIPARWRKPRKVFVNSLSDLFHKDVRYEFMAAVFGVMAACPRHTFQVLTKRPDEMRGFFEWVSTRRDGVSDVREYHRPLDVCWAEAVKHAGRLDVRDFDVWPLPNVWLGVSVEDQATADERIPLLLQTPAAVRFVSYEPALGPVDFRQINARDEEDPLALYFPLTGEQIGDGMNEPANGPRLDWLIVGGESGPGARPCDVAWIRSAVEQCREAGVACFVKQLGARPVGDYFGPDHAGHPLRGDLRGNYIAGGLRDNAAPIRDRKGGNPAEWPEDLHVREFPGGAR